MTVKLYFVYTAAIVCAAPAMAQERFDSAEAAAQAVIDAADSHDSARLSAILGPRAAESSPPAVPPRTAPNRPNSRAWRAPSTGSKSLP